MILVGIIVKGWPKAFLLHGHRHALRQIRRSIAETMERQDFLDSMGWFHDFPEILRSG